MNTKVKLIVAALSAAGVIAPLPALADTITPLVTTLTPQSPVVGNVYSVSYPVTVTLAGGTPQALAFTYNSDGTWTTPAGWSYDASLNPNANTAVFTTISGTTEYGIAISSTGTSQFTPGIGAPSTTTPPSVGAAVLNRPVTSPTLAGWAGATATGVVDGVGITTAPLAGAPAVVQIIGVGSGGAPVGTATIGAPTSTPTSATSGPGSAGGSVVVNSNQPSQSIGWGEYTATFPTTATPAGTASVSGTIAGSSGTVGAGGIFLNNVTGTATYDTTTGVINATPVETSTFSVMPNGDTHIGGALHVAGQTSTNGLANTGNMTNSGSLTTGSLTVNGPAVVTGSLHAGATSTAGLTNTGAMTTTTLTVTGATVTNGISNFGNLSSTGNATVGGTLGVTGNTTIAGTLTASGVTNTGNVATTTLGVTGNATIGGTLAVAGQSNTHGITNTGTFANSGNATIGGTLGVTGASTLNGATTVNNTLAVTGATTLGSASGTGGNTVVVNSTGVTASAGTSSLALTSSNARLSSGGSSLTMASTGASFAGSSGSPVRVTGIAEGSSEWDAVNFRQFDEARQDASRGIAATAAALNIPQLDQNKAFNLGIGVGGYDGEVGFAVGGSARVSRDGIIRASVAGAGSGELVWGVGGGWSW